MIRIKSFFFQKYATFRYRVLNLDDVLIFITKVQKKEQQTYWGCQDISSYTLSTYAISTVAISTAHNFNLLQFRPKLILANGS